MGLWQHHGSITTVAVHRGSTMVVLGGTDGAVMVSKQWYRGTWWYSAVLWWCHSSTVMLLWWYWWYRGSTIPNIDVDPQEGQLVFSWKKKEIQHFLPKSSGFSDVKGFQFRPRRELSAAVPGRASAGAAGLWKPHPKTHFLGSKVLCYSWGRGDAYIAPLQKHGSSWLGWDKCYGCRVSCWPELDFLQDICPWDVRAALCKQDSCLQGVIS